MGEETGLLANETEQEMQPDFKNGNTCPPKITHLVSIDEVYEISQKPFYFIQPKKFFLELCDM